MGTPPLRLERLVHVILHDLGGNLALSADRSRLVYEGWPLPSNVRDSIRHWKPTLVAWLACRPRYEHAPPPAPSGSIQEAEWSRALCVHCPTPLTEGSRLRCGEHARRHKEQLEEEAARPGRTTVNSRSADTLEATAAGANAISQALPR